MKIGGFIVLCLAVGALLTGCDGGGSDSGSGSPADVSGGWGGSGRYDQGTEIQSFVLNLTQNGNALGGNYSVTRVGRSTMTGTVNGSIAGSTVNITMSPHGRADGSVNGNTMALYWYESGFGGSGGGGNVNLSR